MPPDSATIPVLHVVPEGPLAARATSEDRTEETTRWVSMWLANWVTPGSVVGELFTATEVDEACSRFRCDE